MPTRAKAELDPNGGVTKRQAIKQGQPGSTRGADMKRKPPCCCCSSGCFRIPLSARAPSCRPATRMLLRNLREKSEAALRCLASMRGKRLKVSSSAPARSKQPAAALDSHRNQAVEDCIIYINSSAAPSSATTSTSTSTSSSSSSLSSTVILPPPQIPPKSVVTEPVITVSTTLPPPHLPSISNPQCESSKGLMVEKSTRSSCP